MHIIDPWKVNITLLFLVKMEFTGIWFIFLPKIIRKPEKNYGKVLFRHWENGSMGLWFLREKDKVSPTITPVFCTAVPGGRTKTELEGFTELKRWRLEFGGQRQNLWSRVPEWKEMWSKKSPDNREGGPLQSLRLIWVVKYWRQEKQPLKRIG